MAGDLGPSQGDGEHFVARENLDPLRVVADSLEAGRRRDLLPFAELLFHILEILAQAISAPEASLMPTTRRKGGERRI
ncbi:MAG TPA: hypothetical protein VGI99_00765 [Gemmataceae bacterium]|jgi:hypothetical protein